MALTCPRCSRTLSDSADPAEAPLFCMFCGERLRPSTADETIIRVVQPSPVSQLLSAPPEEAEDAATTRTGGGDPSDPGPPNYDTAPSSVGGFRLMKFIGGGGMGNVYEAEDSQTGTRVAVKLLSRRLSTNPASVERFRQEGRLASQLTHPRCVFVLRADADNGRPFIVMELMPGRTLKDEVDARGPLPVGEAVGYMLDVIDGLIEAHRLGVIHRDVKPSNCFLTADGRVKVGDFGLSKSLAGDTAKQLTHSGTFLGTVLFAPPEQIRHEPVGYDSDVYSVAATLYYLLAGQAPHQHDSLTAVLAKAISEPAPPLRPKRPDLPRALERVILKGLERDRTRRYQSLEEMRDALAEELPGNEAPAGVRSLVLAYLIDYVIVQAVHFPLEMMRALFSDLPQSQDQFAALAFGGLFSLIYFTLFEGILAATPGKFLFRLRVRRVGRSGPPGLGWATLRTLAYTAIWVLPLLVAILAATLLGATPLWVLFAPIGWVVSVGVLLVQLRKTDLGYRGVHDLVTGTRVVQKPAPARRSRMVSPYPNPLDTTLPSVDPLPERLGLFKIVGKVCDVDDGGQVWAGEDESLGRRVILRLEPPGAGDDARFDEPIVRPTRLRAVGHGSIEWGGGTRGWVAYVAPAGGPLPDVVSEQKPLTWADARGVLEQLVGELIDADRDGTTPPGLTPEQVWVEPSGRVKVLDFPLPTGKAVSAGQTRSRYPGGGVDPFQSLRRITTLMLEGRPRTSPVPVVAPLPPAAAELTSALMRDEFRTLSDVQTALAESRQHPAEVTTGMRAGHLSVQAVLCAFWLVLMFFLSGFLNWFVAIGASVPGLERNRLLDALDSPDERQKWVEVARRSADTTFGRERLERFERLLADGGTDDLLAPLREETERRMRLRREAERRLNWVERTMLQQITEQITQQIALDPDYPDDLEEVDSYLRRHEDNWQLGAPDDVDAFSADPSNRLTRATVGVGLIFALVLAQWPLFWWPLFSVIFRGGIARWIAGLEFVRRDGRPASRWVCGLRTLLAWLPLLLVLLTVLALQVFFPYWVYVRTSLWLLAITLLPLMAVLALRRPDRGPLDRLFGTTIVPA